MQNKSGKVFVLRSIDSTTASVAQEARFEISDWAALCSLLQKPPSEFDPRASRLERRIRAHGRQFVSYEDWQNDVNIERRYQSKKL